MPSPAKMTEKELRILRNAADDLASIRQEIHAIHEYQKAGDAYRHKDVYRPIPIELKSDDITKGAIKKHYESENRERNSVWRKLKPWVEALGVAIAFVLATLTYRTLQEIRAQTPSIITSGNAATAAIEIANRGWCPKVVLVWYSLA